MKLDIHLNLGQVPESKKKTPFYVSPEKLALYIKEQQLTHAVVLFPDYKEWDELRKLVPEDVILYPLLWVVDSKFELREDLRGICVHSHRGTLDGKEYGLDYSSLKMLRIFDQLPDQFIVCVHTQGVNSYRNISRVLSISRWAVRYPNLKFLAEHSGSFMRKEFYPTLNSFDDLSKEMVQAFLVLAVGSEVCINEAITVSERLSNVFLDTSIVASNNYKCKLLSRSNRWCWGSDYPFENGLCSVQKQEKLFRKYYNFDDFKVQEVYERGKEFLELDTKSLYEKYGSQKDIFKLSQEKL